LQIFSGVVNYATQHDELLARHTKFRAALKAERAEQTLAHFQNKLFWGGRDFQRQRRRVAGQSWTDGCNDATLSH